MEATDTMQAFPLLVSTCIITTGISWKKEKMRLGMKRRREGKERQKVKKVKRKEGGEEFLKDEVLWDEKAMKKHSESESWGKIHVSQDTHIFL